MKTPQRFVLALLVASAGTAALAVEGEQDSTWITPSTLSRAEVRAELQAAPPAAGEAGHTVTASSGGAAKRAQVRAETREAMRLGLVPQQEGTRAATPQDEARIRDAGLRALDNGSVYAGR